MSQGDQDVRSTQPAPDDREPLGQRTTSLPQLAAAFTARVEAICQQLKGHPSPMDDEAACDQLRQQIVSCLSETLGRLQKAESRYRALLEHAHETIAVEAQERLEASERKYRLLVENIPQVVWQATDDGRLIFVSSQVEAMCGFTPAEVMAAGASFWFGRIHPDDVGVVRERYTRLGSVRHVEAEYRFQRKDGEWIWIHSARVVTTQPDGSIVVDGTSADITERKRLEDQLRQSQKMEAIGQLTGGIAHDFNNILAIILGNARFLLDELDGSDPRHADAKAILEAGERAASLTRQLLMFSRRQIVRFELLDVNKVVGELQQMLQRVVREDIDLTFQLAEQPGAVLADATEIEQVIMNLVVNARDAMPGGGHLSIETANIEIDADLAVAHGGIAPGPYVVVTVTDTGCGMDAATRHRAFEPFFTTKGTRGGTGLGLSTCYGIVQRCHGHISVYSEVGRGTVFKVYLPMVDRRSTVRAGTARRDDAGGTEAILLIEDDHELRRTIGRQLAACGYHVVSAANGAEALAICRQPGETINLVLTDMVMPGLNGADTAQLIVQERPTARVLLMSGYSDHPVLRHGSPAPTVNFIQKPFTARALAAKVREVLDAPVLTS